MKFFSSVLASLVLAMVGASGIASAQVVMVPPAQEPGTIASRLMLRGEPYGIQVTDMRAQKRNDVLVVQTELVNADKGDRQVYWRYRWLDGSGMQIGDGETWKPLLIYGQQSQFLRGTAPSSQAVDFRLEMNVEKR